MKTQARVPHFKQKLDSDGFSCVQRVHRIVNPLVAGRPTPGASLYDLIRPRQHRRRDREAEGLGGLEVDH